MGHEMKKIEESGEYEVMDLKEQGGDDSLYFVRHAGAPQSVIRKSVDEARETAAIMDRVLNVYRSAPQESGQE
jgi:hypothetical protein